MTLNQLDDLNNRGGWNDTFDRKCIPFIADHIKEIFSHLDDFHSGMFKYPGNDEVTLTRHTLQARRGMGDLFELLSSSIR